MIHDPILHAENTVKNIHDGASKYTRPVLQQYPLLFSFLIVFSAAAIMHGFELWADTIPFFREHPAVLMGLGVAVLLSTGMLYKALKRM